MKTINSTLLLTLLCITQLFLAGCGTSGNLQGDIDTDAFQQFTASIVELQQGTDRAMQSLVNKSAASFRARLADEFDDPEVEYPETLLSLSDMAFGQGDSVFSMENVPYFADVPAFKLAMFRSNEALKAYAEFLAALADPVLLGSEGQTMQEMKDELNANMASAMTSLNPDISPENQGAVAIFSDVAGSLMERHLQNYQKSTLIGIIEANQAGIAGFAAHMQDGVSILAGAHNDEFESERRKFLIIAANAELETEARMKAALALVDLVQEHMTLIEVLLKLHATYGELPAAHQQLAILEGGAGSGLSRIISFAERAKHLNEIYDQTVEQARLQGLQARKDEAEAVATAAEVAASRTAVQVAELKLEISALAQAAEDDPDDAVLATQLSALQENLAILQEEQERQTSKAKALREAATAVGAAIDDLTGQLQ